MISFEMQQVNQQTHFAYSINIFNFFFFEIKVTSITIITKQEFTSDKFESCPETQTSKLRHFFQRI